MAGFLATGVLMPLITVVAVSTSGEGILGLARRVGPRFGLV
ncbi:MAG: branched-chain amino acid transport system II carrier protein, partial [Neisseria elongata]